MLIIAAGQNFILLALVKSHQSYLQNLIQTLLVRG